MTNGQIAQLRELSKCWMPFHYRRWVNALLHIGDALQFEFPYSMDKFEERRLRRLTHQYRHQIKAMKRNRK
jgi:hypothetical protein